MLRSALTSRSMAILAAGFLVSQMAACTPAASGDGSGGNGSGSGGNKGTGGSSSGSGGSSSGSGGSSSGSGGKVGTGGSSSGSGGSSSGSGGSSTGSGGTGTNGSGGTGTTGSGGTGTTGSGGTGTTGSGGNGTTGSGGAGGGATGTGGAAGGSNGNPDCTAAANIISDFEEGTTGVTINPKGGIWYAYKGMVGTQMPASVPASTTPTGITTATDGTGTCKGALHVQGTGLTDYSGFGATLAPVPAGTMLQLSKPVDVSSHKGISFKIKSGSGTPAAVYFDLKTKESAPMAEGGNLSDAASSNPDSSIGLRNNRGQMLVSPWTSPAISTTWQTIKIPFGTLIPRWVPAAGSTNACPAPGTGVAKCQAPPFVPTDVLGLEFSIYSDPGFPKPSGSSPGTYDLWIDDVAWLDDDSGLPTMTGFPLTGAGSVGMCTKPTGADGKNLVTAYNLWKATFVSGSKVIRPENGNDTVSEGIAYGMLIAVNMNDKTLFDSLYTFWKGNHAAGGTPGLMTWCLPSGGGSCSASGGSATDADEDAAFALLQAGKVFAQASYTTDATSLIGDIWSKDIDTSSNLPTGGSNYSNSTSSKVTDPSYFAPAYYRAFAAVDSGHAWGAVADKSISVLNGGSAWSKGLVPAWCSSNCTAVGSNGAATDGIYQYDSHRIPMRVGLDYCWNGTAAAKTYTDKTTTFFATDAHAGKDGIGRISDLYNLDGTAASGSAPNSASIIGTAAVGAMASAGGGAANKQFLDDAYQAVFDMVTRGTLAPVDAAGKTPYSYYNATVGMLTLLIMTGNFSH